MTEECKPTIDSLALKLAYLEKVFDVHRIYQKEQVDKAYKDLMIKLDEMNKFREENRELTAKFATVETLSDRTAQFHLKIEVLQKHIEDGIGKRLTTLELYRANLDGRFWIWGVLIILLTLFLQFWPLLKH